ncbi:MAG: hypothetical protein ACXQTM_05820 [Methanosarcinales archaeon]
MSKEHIQDFLWARFLLTPSNRRRTDRNTHSTTSIRRNNQAYNNTELKAIATSGKRP